MRDVDYRILGSLEALFADEYLPLGGLKQRAVLAILVLNANRVVTGDALVEALWPDKRPARPGTAIQGYVSSLRRILDPNNPFEVIVTEPAGYRLPVAAGRLDLHRLEAALDSAREALSVADLGVARQSLEGAVALFRGEPLADFTHAEWARLEIRRLQELRLVCLEERIEVDLALGRHADLVGELEALVSANPLRERLRGQLMLALYRSGRQSEALAAYQAARQELVDEFGIDPSLALRELERAILRQDEALGVDLRSTAAPAGIQTLLFTDIESSTALLRRLGDAYGPVLVEHRRLLRESVEAHGGRIVDSYGDGFFACFGSAAHAVEAAVRGQRALAAYPWPERSVVRVRMGLHTGRPVAVGTGLVGLDVHRVARICAAAHGAQILVSEETARAVGGSWPGGVELRDLGTHLLRDMARAEQLYQLIALGLDDVFPPPRIDSQPSPVQRPDRSIMLVQTDESEAFDVSLGVAEALARSQVPHELIVARMIASDGTPGGPALTRAAAELHDLRTSLAERGVATRVAAFTTREAGEDAARLASEQAVDLLLLARSAAELDAGGLDPELESVFVHAPCHVAVCVATAGRDEPAAGGPVVVPFGGGEHEWAGLELGAWIAGATGVPLRLLGTGGKPGVGKRDASRLLASASLAVQQLVGVQTEPELLEHGPDALVHAASGGSFLVVGVPEDWRTRGLGETRLRLAREVAATTVFVRRGVRPGGLAPRGSQTYTWSIADVALSQSS